MSAAPRIRERPGGPVRGARASPGLDDRPRPVDRLDCLSPQSQLDSLRDVIRKGNRAAPPDPNEPDSVAMPSWRETLTDTEISALVACLLNQMPWDELDE